MAFNMNLVWLLILISFVLYGEAVGPLKSIKLSENVIYDCVDIYKQPSLSHPLLKNHTIQMRPTSSPFESKTQVSSTRYKKIIECPDGTVPIMRTRPENVIPNTPQEKGVHMAGVRSMGKAPYRGVSALLSAHNLNVGRNEASSAQQYVAAESNGQLNFIQAGWMINMNLFGDARAWTFASWKGAKGAGCYNTQCKGFVQVAKDNPLSEPIEITKYAVIRFSIHQDKQTGNWWITQIFKDFSTSDVGYWPKELFNLIGDGAQFVGFSGVVSSSPYGDSPPMGNGNRPKYNDPYHSAFFNHLQIMGTKYFPERADMFPLKRLVDSDQCYGLDYAGYDNPNVGVYFTYGGPGGNPCGV